MQAGLELAGGVMWVVWVGCGPVRKPVFLKHIGIPHLTCIWEPLVVVVGVAGISMDSSVCWGDRLFDLNSTSLINGGCCGGLWIRAQTRRLKHISRSHSTCIGKPLVWISVDCCDAVVFGGCVLCVISNPYS